uniref:EF-hand domain-containing protein n=1 Tax=Timema genevievae TaxID=629358 RepID=A0A7R9JRE6_TIMGE|nr:unnamed protein product [Timema genevievae]
MGQGKSQFSEEELQDYQDLSYFTKKEVLYAHQKFKALAPEKIGHNKNAKLPLPKVLTYPELKVNPFGDRICRIFSSSHDGDCTFEDFLDMMSVFSDAAPKAVKAEHAFRIFDFDGDDMLGVTDLRQVVDRLTGPQRLAEQDMQHLIQNILDEADLDDDGALSFAEFEHIISKSSDFANLSTHHTKFTRKVSAGASLRLKVAPATKQTQHSTTCVCIPAVPSITCVRIPAVTSTHGSFIRMKIQQVKKDTSTQRNPTQINRTRFSLGVEGEWVWSRTTNPRPPIVNRKLDARPSMMYWPLTRYGMNATCHTKPLSLDSCTWKSFIQTTHLGPPD